MAKADWNLATRLDKKVGDEYTKQTKDFMDTIDYLETVKASKMVQESRTGVNRLTFMKNNIKDEMSTFFSETSFTALTQIYKANCFWKRLLWIALVLGMFAWLIVQCYWLLVRYYSYPVEVKLDLKASTFLEFPSVTICNLNPIKSTSLQDPRYRPLAPFMSPETKDMLFQQTIDSLTFNDVCKQDEIKCRNGRCLNEVSFCNGKNDCKDGEDEANCEDHPCPFYLWKCTSKPKCISIHLRCDGQPGACSDDSDEDEINCHNNTCPPNFFRCSTGFCISNKYVCDTEIDCDGAEDEINCSERTTKGNDNNIPGGVSGEKAVLYPRNTSNSSPAVPSPKTHRRKREIFKQVFEGDKKYSPIFSKGENHYHKSAQSLLLSTDKNRHTIFKHLESIWDDKGNMTKEDFLRKLHASFFVSQNSAMKRRGNQESGNKKTVLKPTNVDDSFKLSENHRTKRQSRPPPEYPQDKISSMLDWQLVQQNMIFNKWDMLNNKSMSLKFYDERDDEFEAAMTYAFITAKLDPKTVEESGHVKKNFIASCEFGGYQCSPDNFTYFHNHKFGNCYTFNSKFANSSKLETRLPGPENGLRLELFVDQKNYVANLATEAGARVLVHKKGATPFPEDEGFSIMPGRSTSIGIRQISFTRLPSPHGACGVSGVNTDYYAENLGTDYSKLSCLKSCYQDLSLAQCNCYNPMNYVPDITKVCNVLDRDVGHCVMNLHYNASEQLKACDKVCPKPCQETRYDLTISTAKWPSEKYKCFLKAKLDQTNSLYRQIKDSGLEFAKVQIYFQDLIYQHTEQQKAYESMNLISDLGGQLGLWLGLSAITIGELCSFLFGIGRSLLLKFLGNKTTPSQSNTDSVRPVEPATLHEMFQDLCPAATKHNPHGGVVVKSFGFSYA